MARSLTENAATGTMTKPKASTAIPKSCDHAMTAHTGMRRVVYPPVKSPKPHKAAELRARSSVTGGPIDSHAIRDERLLQLGLVEFRLMNPIGPSAITYCSTSPYRS